MKQIIQTGLQAWSLDGTDMTVEVVLASKGTVDEAPPIFTLRMRYPRIIHAEIMTHRVFSRNARSSRAVPVKTMLHEIRSTPFVPWHWGSNQKGMQAGAESNEPVLIPDWDDVNFHGKPHLHSHTRKEAWIEASRCAVNVAEAFDTAGYHKQICNRLLEPFMWIDVLVTSTEWENFLWLRDHEAAEPHLQDLARLVNQAIYSAKIQTLEPGQWHLPYITENNRDWACFDMGAGPNTALYWQLLCKISAARCARISYKPFDGDASYERELQRYDSLVSSDRVHASPLEHQAKVDVYRDQPHEGWYEEYDLRGNFAPGWVQYRKTVPGENHTS